MAAKEGATKRIPVCPKTWKILYQLRKPGQTFDDVIRELVESAAEKRLVEETRRIVRRARFVRSFDPGSGASTKDRKKTFKKKTVQQIGNEILELKKSL